MITLICVTNDEEVKDSIECEMLMSMKGRLMPMDVREVPIEQYLLDEGSIVENKESHGSCDLGGQGPGHTFTLSKDPRMMMNSSEVQHVRSELEIES